MSGLLGPRIARIEVALVVVIGFIWTNSSSAQLPPQHVLDQVSLSVVKIQSKCSGRSRVGTGFFWQQPSRVVTALHLVAGCEKITIHSEHAGVSRAASLWKILKSADLALLSIRDAVGFANLPSLTPASASPKLHEKLVAIGYELGAPTMGSVNLEASFGSSRLSDMLPNAARRAVQRAGMPSLSIDVLRHQGHLVPGLSGAPIINRTGAVVAVGDGGLENGAVSIGWALPIRYVADLIVSLDQLTAEVVAAAPLFAAELEASRGESITCGEMTLTKLRTRRYQDLANTTDDPQGLEIYKWIAKLAEINMSQLAFDIYVHLDTGATIVLPEGLAISSSDRGCIASAFDGSLQVHIRGNWPTTVSKAVHRFLEETMVPTGLLWTFEKAFSYNTPKVRFDGLTVNRASLGGYKRNDPGIILGTPTIIANSHEVLLSRGDAFLGLIILNYNSDTFTPPKLMQCQIFPSPQCVILKKQIDFWISLLLGAYLSTFPIG